MTREHNGTIKLNSPGGCNENAQFWFGPTDYINCRQNTHGILLQNISTGLGLFWDDFPIKKIQSKTWTHPPTSIVISDFFCKAPKVTTVDSHLCRFSVQLKRFKMYTFLMQTRMTAYPELEPSLVEIAIGEVDEPPASPPADSHMTAPVYPGATPPVTVSPRSRDCTVQRSQSDRYSYRAAIHSGNSIDDGLWRRRWSLVRC